MTRVAVLVVEDLPQVRATAVRILQEIGCEVFDAYDGRAALSLLRSNPDIQVLFADVRMPGMNGLELAEEARRLRPDLRIVLTSGYVGRDEVPSEIPFLAKPWRAADIVGAVIPRTH